MALEIAPDSTRCGRNWKVGAATNDPEEHGQTCAVHAPTGGGRGRGTHELGVSRLRVYESSNWASIRCAVAATRVPTSSRSRLAGNRNAGP